MIVRTITQYTDFIPKLSRMTFHSSSGTLLSGPIMKLITIIFIVFLILIVIIANMGLGPSFFPFIYQIPGGDKLGHFFLMGILSFLVNSVLKSRKIRIFSINFLIGTLIVMAVITIEEFSQIFLDYRAFSIIDLLFDYFGIVLFGYLADYLINRQAELNK